MFKFYRPYVGSLIGILLRLLYLGKYQFRFAKFDDRYYAYVYEVEWLFPFWMKVIGQSHGEIIFIHQDIVSNKDKFVKALLHEYTHVQQTRRYGWWGLGFIIKYIWYTIKYGYKNNPLEIEAREAENTTTP
jgi:hypothetical protein